MFEHLFAGIAFSCKHGWLLKSPEFVDALDRLKEFKAAIGVVESDMTYRDDSTSESSAIWNAFQKRLNDLIQQRAQIQTRVDRTMDPYLGLLKEHYELADTKGLDPKERGKMMDERLDMIMTGLKKDGGLDVLRAAGWEAKRGIRSAEKLHTDTLWC